MSLNSKEWLSLVKEDAIEPDLPICDAHYHLHTSPDKSYMTEDFLRDTAGGHRVLQAVYVEANSGYRPNDDIAMSPVGETEFVLAQRKTVEVRVPDIASGIVGFADLTLGKTVERVLAAHIAAGEGRFRGIRHLANWDASPVIMGNRVRQKGLLLDPKFREGFAYLQKYGLSFDAWAFYPQLRELLDLVQAFPETTIILEHIGGPIHIGPYAGKHQEVLREWRQRISELAKCPNLFLKLGGLGMPTFGFDWDQRPMPPRSSEVAEAAAPYLLYCIEKFGVNRCMFESNFPVDKKAYSYTVVWNAFKLVTKDFSLDERSALFHGTAVKAYRLTTMTCPPKTILDIVS
ncbi:amidohydrolase family protein [Chloroflexota bacterium]